MRKRPCSSVAAVRIPSISAGLLASTVTPGSTAPDSSLTTPAMDVCAELTAGTTSAHMNTRIDGAFPGSVGFMETLFPGRCTRVFAGQYVCTRDDRKATTVRGAVGE